MKESPMPDLDHGTPDDEDGAWTVHPAIRAGTIPLDQIQAEDLSCRS